MNKSNSVTKVNTYGIEVCLIRNGKIVEKRRKKVKRFDAIKVYRSINILVECLR